MLCPISSCLLVHCKRVVLLQNSCVSKPSCSADAVSAFVLSADNSVQLDANNMMAGQALVFELLLVSIDPVKT